MGGKASKPGRPRLARKPARRVAATTRAMHSATRRGRWRTRLAAARRRVADVLDTPPPRGVIIAFGVLVLLGALFGWMLYRSADNSESQLEATAGSVIDECRKSDAFAREARARGLCVVAEQAAQTPSATDTGRTDAEIAAIVNRVLDERGTPAVGGVTVEQVREVVRQVLPGLTAQQVESAVAAYLAANLERLRGERGERGESGEAGTPGRGIFSGPRFERGASGCEAVTVYDDGSVYRAPAGDGMCPGGTTPTTTPEPTTEPTAEPTAGPEPTTPPADTTPAPTPAPTTTPTDDGGLLGGLLGD